jgi:hypothetical protein
MLMTNLTMIHLLRYLTSADALMFRRLSLQAAERTTELAAVVTYVHLHHFAGQTSNWLKVAAMCATAEPTPANQHFAAIRQSARRDIGEWSSATMSWGVHDGNAEK